MLHYVIAHLLFVSPDKMQVQGKQDMCIILFMLSSKLSHQHLRVAGVKRESYQRKLGSGHKERGKLVRAGYRNPRREKVSVLLCIAQSLNTVKTESINDFMESVSEKDYFYLHFSAFIKQMSISKKSHISHIITQLPLLPGNISSFLQ